MESRTKPNGDVEVTITMNSKTYRRLKLVALGYNRSTQEAARQLLTRMLINADQAIYGHPPCTSVTVAMLQRSMAPFRVRWFGDHVFRYAVSVRPVDYGKSVLSERMNGTWVRCTNAISREVEKMILNGTASYLEEESDV